MMLEISALSASYGPIAALTNISMSVQAGSIVCLLGSNGAGKSTLLGCVTNSLPCRMSGSIRFEGTEILGLPTDRIIGLGLVMSPEGRQLFSQLTVEENLRVGAHAYDRGRRWRSDLQTVYQLFPVLVERRRQFAATLSGGEQQMVAIGRALMARPKLILLDEPSLGLAPLLVKEIFKLIQKVNAQGVTVLLVEQNARQALGVAKQAYVLEKGRLMLAGSARELMGDAKVVEAYLGET
jgi:branched-chain amino acid transport system ATP-binding protein